MRFLPARSRALRTGRLARSASFNRVPLIVNVARTRALSRAMRMLIAIGATTFGCAHCKSDGSSA